MSPDALTDEQRAFVEAIRDFARRECGTREQRDALTDHGREPHNQELYERIAELGWLGVSIPEEYGGAGGGAVDMCLLCEEFSRGQIPMGFFPITMMSARPIEQFATEELKQEILTGIVRRQRRGDRDVGARGRLGRRQPVLPGASAIDGSYVINGQKTWITGAHAAEPHPARVPHQPRLRQAPRAVDDLGAGGRRGDGDPRRSRRWAAARSTTCSSPTAECPPTG